jgi:hypothetical protein
VVAGSNPVSPTRVLAGERRFREIRDRLLCTPGGPYPNAYPNQGIGTTASQSESPRQAVDGRPSGVFGGVAVDVAGDRDRGVAEQIGHWLDMDLDSSQATAALWRSVCTPMSDIPAFWAAI